ncbi:MAG: type IV toxin-antitoxin system AbiEi family antitoxin [Propionibacteriaceae bacterium]|jgi:hypothetical protein|nr:type IV toxin-antitoxin system AbiEi family antitoxin [Propionibacteriaceae bacterium]
MTPPAETVDGYCAAGDLGALTEAFFLVDDPAGNVTVRATDFKLIVPGERAPEAVVGVDLLGSADPRQAAAGRAILERLLR